MAAAKKAGQKMERYETLKSPKGIAGFSFLREPDEKFGAKHRVQVFIDPNDPEAKAFVKTLMATKTKYLLSIGKKDDGKVPALKKADAYLAERFGSHGVKEGSLYFEFTSNARKVGDTEEWEFVKIYDVKNAETPDIRVFSGDVIRVAVTLMGYNTGKEAGVKPYLNAVQVLVKKNNGGRSNPFTDESAAFATEETPAEEPATDAALFADESPTVEAPAEPAVPAPKAETKKPAKVAAAAAPVADEGGVSLADLV